MPASINSRYGSQALACGLRPGRGGQPGSVDVSLAGFAGAPDPVDVSMAGFGGDRPQRPGPRIPIPAAFKYALAVSR